MSSKITIGMDNQTGPGLDQIRRDLARMGIAGDKAEAAMSQLNAELESRAARKQAEQVKALADQLDGTADKMAAAKKAQDALNASMAAAKSSGGDGMGWVNMASKVNIAKTAFHGLMEGSKKAWEGIKYLSEQGVEGFQSLEGAGNSMHKTFIDALKTDQFKALGESVAVGVDRMAVPAIKNMVGIVGALGTAVTATTGALSSMGGVDMSELRAELVATVAEQKAAAKTLADIQSSNKNAEQVYLSVQKASKQAAMQQTVSQLTKEHEVIAAIHDERMAIERLNKEGKFQSEEAQASLAKLMALEAQKAKLSQDQHAEVKQQNEANKARQEADAKDRVESEKNAAEEITRNEKKAAEDRWRDAMDRIDMRQAAEKRAMEERIKIAEQEAKAKAEAQTKLADNLKGNAGAIVAGLDPRKVAQRVGQQREKAAFDQFGRAHNREYLDAQAEGDTGTMRQLERQQREAGNKARRQGFRDVKRGNAGSDEIIQAQQGLANDVIGNAEATGRVNSAQGDALREAANTMARQQEQLDRLEQDIQATGADMRQIRSRSGNATNRAQRAGG